MGRRKREAQGSLWIAAVDLPQSGGRPFYELVNRILDEEGFDPFVESRCRCNYADKMGRPSLPPAIYFRMLMIGYFEGIDSERGIAWRVGDSLALRRFLGYGLTDPTADHSTISRTRRRTSVETHQEVFKGYHSDRVLTTQKRREIRTYIAEPDRGRRTWQSAGMSDEAAAAKLEARDTVYGNRRRTGGERGKELMRGRGELAERSFAHCYDTGGPAPR